MTVLRPGQTTTVTRNSLDHDTVGSLATGEPKPLPGMRWKVLGLPSTGQKSDRQWRFIAHARDEQEAKRIGRSAVRTPEWTKWCHQRIAVAKHRVEDPARPRSKKSAQVDRSLDPIVVLGLVRRVLAALDQPTPSGIEDWDVRQLECLYRQLDGNTVLSSHARAEAKRGVRRWRKQAGKC
jgi:hypothetical protein